ncbi:MAG: hypothetical protein H6816_14295 [Phycisphaerales bacterium]|nr:hypothetical protein [Phycisphaerales bacterium]
MIDRTRGFVAFVAGAVGILLAGCTASSSGPSPSPSPTPTPNPSADTYRLNVILRTGNGDRLGMEVFAFYGDVVYTRANAPYFDNAVAQQRFVSSEDPETFMADVPKGKTVTLVAVEFKGDLPSALSGNGNYDNPYAVEFLNWEGDYDSRPESGVASVAMNGEKTVTAVFAAMPQVLIRKYDSNNPQFNGGCFDIKIEAAEHLGIPGSGDLSGETPDVCCCPLSDGSHLFLAGHVKSGTQITLTATDSNSCTVDDAHPDGICYENFDHWEGSAALCGSARECTIPVTVDSDSTAVWVDNTP